jgi:hypothetical protein
MISCASTCLPLSLPAHQRRYFDIVPESYSPFVCHDRPVAVGLRCQRTRTDCKLQLYRLHLRIVEFVAVSSDRTPRRDARHSPHSPARTVVIRLCIPRSLHTRYFRHHILLEQFGHLPKPREVQCQPTMLADSRCDVETARSHLPPKPNTPWSATVPPFQCSQPATCTESQP